MRKHWKLSRVAIVLYASNLGWQEGHERIGKTWGWWVLLRGAMPMQGRTNIAEQDQKRIQKGGNMEKEVREEVGEEHRAWPRMVQAVEGFEGSRSGRRSGTGGREAL